MTIRSAAFSDINAEKVLEMADKEEIKRKRIYPEKMTCEHLGGVAQIEKECFRSPWSENSLKLLCDEGIGMGMVCRSDGKICAYGGMLCIIDEGQITNIATLPEYRRMGYGAAVVEALKKYAKNNGIRSITLEVRESNKAAISLYTSHGFKVTGKRKDFYTDPREDALIMACEVR